MAMYGNCHFRLHFVENNDYNLSSIFALGSLEHTHACIDFVDAAQTSLHLAIGYVAWSYVMLSWLDRFNKRFNVIIVTEGSYYTSWIVLKNI